MIKFFRHIRKSLLWDNLPNGQAGKTSKYFKYAIGEIILVVFGILIALQVNNWNENRKNIKVASELQSRLINDITTDIAEIDKRVTFFENLKQFGFSIEEELSQPQALTIEDKWQFLVNIFHTSQRWDFTPSSTTYNEIQNSNLIGYIGSSELSNDLSQYYIHAPIQLEQINGGTAAYRDYTRSNIPIKIQEYMWERCYNSKLVGTQLIIACKDPDIHPEIIESLYQSIVSDQKFKKILTNRLSTIYVRNALYINNKRLAEAIISHIKSTQ
jgi:hypothetical protein